MDKFLKVSRLIKRREIAKQLCDASKVLPYANKSTCQEMFTLIDEGEM